MTGPLGGRGRDVVQRGRERRAGGEASAGAAAYTAFAGEWKARKERRRSGPPEGEDLRDQHLHHLAALVQRLGAHGDHAAVGARAGGRDRLDHALDAAGRRRGGSGAARRSRRRRRSGRRRSAGRRRRACAWSAAAVCQPLAARPPKKVPSAVASSRWKGCGSNSAAKALIASAVISRERARSRPLADVEVLEVELRSMTRSPSSGLLRFVSGSTRPGGRASGRRASSRAPRRRRRPSRPARRSASGRRDRPG